ncbi:hypothetical protein STEG23_028843 [Scotinomys teguina]
MTKWPKPPGGAQSIDPGAPGRHHTTRTQEHPDAITPQGPRSTGTPSHHKDPEHPDTFTTQATRWDPGTPDAIGLGGPRCNQTILDQENPEVPPHHWTRRSRSTHNPLDQKKTQEHSNSSRKGLKSTQPPLDQDTYPCPIIPGKNGPASMQKCFNIIKNKTTPESSPPPTPKSDYCNADKGRRK